MKAVLLAAKNQVCSVSIPLDMVSSLNETILAGKDINKNDWEALLAMIPESTQNILGERDDFNNKGIADRLHLIQEVNKEILNNSFAIIENNELLRENERISQQQIKEQLKLKEQEGEKLLKSIELAKSSGASDEVIRIMQESLSNLDKEINKFLEKERIIKFTTEISLNEK